MTGRLVYTALGSLDGYVADTAGDFGFAEPDDELHARVNEIFARGTLNLIGRRSYQVMDFWDTADIAELSGVAAEFARIWRSQDKVVYSASLPEVTHPRTRLERVFDPEAVRGLKESTQGELSIGGATLAGEALRHGLLDEIHAFLHPTVVGGGLAMFPPGTRADLDLLEVRRFAGGAVGLHYRVRGAGG